MKNKIWLIYSLLFCSIFLPASDILAAKKQPKPDIRILIDISGSMKKNDPNNLRIPALQLVTNLMPTGADAGVWAFGRYVNMMVPLAKVDNKWQSQATETANKINSRGLYTNIGGVLDKASYGWIKPSETEKRSIILLTDGMVDISKDPAVNEKEREKILNTILPKLAKAGVAIHTIALSKNADHELLKSLSTQTDGWYQAVESAEELQKVFLKIFEQSAERDSLPLTENQFKVDSSINEITVLIFKENPLDETKIIQPNGEILQESSQDGSVRWFATANYDLITVQDPQAGNWKVDAKVSPDNRVMIVSDLGLNVAEVPNNLLAGEAIHYEVSLVEKGETITKPDFLNLVESKLIQNKDGQTSRLAMFFDNTNHSFKQNFFTDDYEGVLELTLELKSPTFERKRNHAINVYGSPLTHELTVSEDGNQPHRLLFSVREDIVQKESLNVNLTLSFPDGEKQFLAIKKFDVPLELKTFPEGGKYKIELDIKGQSILGREFSVSPAPINFETKPTQAYLDSQSNNEKAANEESIKEELEEQVEEPAEDKVEDPKVEDIQDTKDEPEETDWMSLIYIGLGANLVIVILGFIGWRVIKSRNAKNIAKMSEELGIEEDDNEENQQDKEESQKAGAE